MRRARALCLLRLLRLREIALRVASDTHHDAYSPPIACCAGFARSDGSVHVRRARAEARVAGNLTILTAAHALPSNG